MTNNYKIYKYSDYDFDTIIKHIKDEYYYENIIDTAYDNHINYSQNDL